MSPWLLLLACKAPPDAGPHRLPQPETPRPIALLERLEASRLDLPPTNLPPGARADGRHVLASGWRRVGGGPVPLWSRPCPIRTRAVRPRTAPGGARLLVDGEPLPYTLGVERSARRPAWAISRGRLLVRTASDPREAEVVLEDPTEPLEAARRNLAASGLRPAEFVRYEATIGKETRPALLLPAPGRASWRLAVPPGARLEFAAGLLPRTWLEGRASDGALVEVLVDGEPLLRRRVLPEEPFKALQVDLSHLAGREVDLTLATGPAGDTAWDHVVLGTPRIVPGREAPPRRVVWIGIDTLRRDATTVHGYGRDTTAALERLARESAVFDRAWTPAPRTRPSFRAALTGHWPLEAIGRAPVAEAFQAAGWATAGFSANVHLVPRFGFHRGSDLWHYDNGADAGDQLGAALDWLRRHADQDAFAFVHLMDPHVFYDAPGLYRDRYVEHPRRTLPERPNRWEVARLQREGRLTEDDRGWLRDRYDGEVRYMADALADFVGAVLDLPGDTLLVVHSDHGEEFWDHGGYEHNHTLYRELLEGLLWIRPPGGLPGGKRLEVPVGWIDLVPTVLDLAGVPPGPLGPLPGESLAPLVLGEDPALQERLRDRPLPLGHLMYDRERWGVVDGDRVFLLETASGRHELYDLHADPLQQQDLAPTASPEALERAVAALGRATGWPAGPGLRLWLERAPHPFRIACDAPVEIAVIDPEAARTRRANLEWGEEAPVSPEDVATLDPPERGRTVEVRPGEVGRGVVALVTGRDVACEVRSGEETRPIEGERGRLEIDDLRIRFARGPVLLPRVLERDRVGRGAEPRAEALEALRALGYVE